MVGFLVVASGLCVIDILIHVYFNSTYFTSSAFLLQKQHVSPKMKFLLATTLLTSLTAAYVPVPRADVNAQNGRPPTRKDITTMGAEEYSLFILAMQQWQKSSASDIGGYYQVAGIHGAPHQYWDNGGGFQNTGQGNKGGGYCFHGTKDFYL